MKNRKFYLRSLVCLAALLLAPLKRAEAAPANVNLFALDTASASVTWDLVSGCSYATEKKKMDGLLKSLLDEFQYKAQLIIGASRKAAGTNDAVFFLMQMMRMSGKTRMVGRVIEPVETTGPSPAFPMVGVLSGGTQPNVDKA